MGVSWLIKKVKTPSLTIDVCATLVQLNGSNGPVGFDPAYVA